MDALHEVNIEIVSPSFMNQKQVGDTIFIPKKARTNEEIVESVEVEGKIFDKAEQAESIEKRKETLAEIEVKIKETESVIKGSSEENEIASLKTKVEKLRVIREKMLASIDKKVEEISARQ